MFERFTDAARQSVARAQEEARLLDSGHIGTEHLLIALAGEPQGVGGRVLRQLGATPEELRADARRLAAPGSIDRDALATLGIDLEEVKRRVEETFGPGALDVPACGDVSGHIPFSRKAKKTLELALRSAVALDDNFIGSEHILLGLARATDGTAARILAERELDVKRLEAAIQDARRAA
jgi:ATP-dependent Clp protease ATP-binding subunit ClpA